MRFRKLLTSDTKAWRSLPSLCRQTQETLSESDADRCRSAAEKAGLEVVGLHWLMAETEGLHLTHSDPAILEVTQEHLIKLGKLTAKMNGSIPFWVAPSSVTSFLAPLMSRPLNGR